MELQISDLLRAIKQRLLFIIVITFASVAVTGWVSWYVLIPQYEATTTLLVQPKNLSNESIASEKLVPTFDFIVRSRKIASDVIQRLKLDISEDDLLEKVEVTGLRNSLVTKITVTHPDPAQAVAIANSFAQSFRESLPGIMNVGNISILDEAELENPLKPVQPKPYFNMAIVLVLALNTGMGIAILWEVLDKTVKSEEVLEKILGIPVLATIGRYSAKRRNKDGKLFCLEEPNSSIAEAYRTLRTNIRYMKLNRKTRTLLITSAIPKEGKTFIAANLAVAMAQEGKQVLLIDCNLRNPTLHKTFNIPNEQGLTSVLTNQISLDGTIFPAEQNNLDIIPSGPIPPNPSELLGMPEMAALIDICKQRYDIILFDTPPVIPVTDTQVLARLLNAVLLVTKLNGTLCESVQQAKNLLDHVGDNVVGTVANYKRMKAKFHYGYQEKPLRNTNSTSSLKQNAECSQSNG